MTLSPHRPRKSLRQTTIARDLSRVPNPSRLCVRWEVRRRAIYKLVFVLVSLNLSAPAQQLIGYVSTSDANVTGASDVMDGHAVLSGSVAVTAKDHTAPITLGRGGTVRVCQTSVLHLTESKAAILAAPLLLSLDRGAIEIQMKATTDDTVMTPDLRFAIRLAGPLDLRLRIARNGDTCVENRGPSAPTIAVSDPFGESMYELYPNQHVLFEHGSLREVVDHERTACGCPDTPTMSIADALVAPGIVPGPGPVPGSAKAPADQHPFPTAVSEGLAPAAEVPAAPAGTVHAQVTGTLTYNAQPTTSPEAPPPTAAAVVEPPPPPPHRNVVQAVGHFFRKLFGGS